VTSWSEFAAAEPAFAQRVLERFTLRKHSTVATLRHDGSPRISGTEVSFDSGELSLGVMPGSVKALDLRRDARMALHAPTLGGKGYVARGMSLGDLQAKLNADLERFPPPESPDPRRRTGRWGRSSVWEILRNPKYTGYQVWNRRARKRGGKTNPPEQWIWSEEPAHDALVSREMFEEAARRSVSRDNVTKAAAARADYAPPRIR
jgi:Recombinase